MRCWGLPIIRYAPLHEIEDDRSVDLIVSAGTWEAVSGSLRLKTATRTEVNQATIEYWDALTSKLSGDVVYAVGGGLAADAAKYAASKTGKPLVCIPTAISVDAFLTWASGYRESGCVRYIETKPPDEVVIDFEIIANAPAAISAAGITDVLSIATGRRDWKFAHDAGRNPSDMDYDKEIDAVAEGILRASLQCAACAGEGETAGLRRLVECLALEVQLCNLIGHSRPEEGSEHYFAYAAEEVLGKGLPHGDLVGPGIAIMAYYQGQDVVPLTDAMRACNVPLDNISDSTIREILLTLPGYCEKHELPYGIAHTLQPQDVDNFDPTILK